MKELQDYKRDIWNCFRDSMCKSVFTWHLRSAEFYQICPSLSRYKFDAYSAQGRVDIARAIIEDEIEWSDKIAEIIYQDPLCGACNYICGRIKEMQPCDIIQAMRVQFIKDGNSPPGGFRNLMESLKKFQNPYEKPNAQRAKWLNELIKEFHEETDMDVTIPEGKATDTILYVGCSPLRDRSAEAMPKTALKLLIKAGVNVGILGEQEKCCGNPSLRVGDQTEFVAFARENIKKFNELGVNKVVCTCPFCYSTFKRDYPEVGDKMNFQVFHILEFVDQLIKEGKIKLTKPVNLSVTYHDPCHLGRLSENGICGTGDFTGIYDQPRDILRSIPGIRLMEMDRIKDDSWCCGAGGWLRNGYPDLAQWTAGERINEAKTTGAEAIATYCPHCEENMGEALVSKGDKMKVLNLLDLALKAIP
ncbi:(Fe-S)-binding protein [Chloroflexota bacterium]